MKMHEMAAYALLKPEIYGWNYYIPFSDLKEGIDALKERKTSSLREKWELITNNIRRAAFGCVTWLLRDERINNKEYLGLVARIEELSNRREYLKLLEFYKTADEILNLHLGNTAKEVRKSIGYILRKLKGSFWNALRVSRYLKKLTDDDVWDKANSLIQAAVKMFLKNNIDETAEYRFLSPSVYNKAVSKLGPELGATATCIIGTPAEASCYFEHLRNREKDRYGDLVKIGAPGIILRNTERNYYDNEVFFTASNRFRKKEADEDWVFELIGEYAELKKGTFNVEKECGFPELTGFGVRPISHEKQEEAV